VNETESKRGKDKEREREGEREKLGERRERRPGPESPALVGSR